MKEHPHAELLRAIADGESLADWEYSGGDDLYESAINAPLYAMVGNECTLHFRRKQKMLSINGHEFPEPTRVAPKVGQTYWPVNRLVNPFSDTDDYKWEGDDYDKLWLSRGLCHTTREAAEAHRRAIILASGGTL